ncbi:MAG TPA: helix-turn-helix transcriptional regulator [Rugosimonospora sp.]|nr:helix-turn-helix transcriptional regulator [Rugosimonospora sp.]
MSLRTVAPVLPQRVDALSPYQLRVLQLMAEGRSNAAIAEQLGVSRRAVENQVSRLMQVLGLGRADDGVAARVCAVLIYLSHTGDLASPN